MNEPIFVISGDERRQEKKRLAELKQFVKMFWYFEDIDRVYGGGLEDEKCEKLLEQKNKEIKVLEEKLAEKIL